MYAYLEEQSDPLSWALKYREEIDALLEETQIDRSDTGGNDMRGKSLMFMGTASSVGKSMDTFPSANRLRMPQVTCSEMFLLSSCAMLDMIVSSTSPFPSIV